MRLRSLSWLCASGSHLHDPNHGVCHTWMWKTKHFQCFMIFLLFLFQFHPIISDILTKVLGQELQKIILPVCAGPVNPYACVIMCLNSLKSTSCRLDLEPWGVQVDLDPSGISQPKLLSTAQLCLTFKATNPQILAHSASVPFYPKLQVRLPAAESSYIRNQSQNNIWCIHIFMGHSPCLRVLSEKNESPKFELLGRFCFLGRIWSANRYEQRKIVVCRCWHKGIILGPSTKLRFKLPSFLSFW